MSFQLWTVFHLISLILPIYLLVNISKMKPEQKTESEKYYSLFLISLMSLPIVNFIEINSPDNAPLMSEIFGRLFYVSAGLLLFFFVMSAEYFTEVPKKYEILFFLTPLIGSFVVNFVSPYQPIQTSYGWQGTWVNPIAKYSWLGLANIVAIYAVVNLLFLRKSIINDVISRTSILTFSINQELKYRLKYFIISAFLALSTGTLSYVLAQVYGVPNLAALAVSFSLLPSYLSFKEKVTK